MVRKWKHTPENGDRDDFLARLQRLSEREREVLALIAEGKGNKDIARVLCITTYGVKAHAGRILFKLGVESRTRAAVLWERYRSSLP